MTPLLSVHSYICYMAIAAYPPAPPTRRLSHSAELVRQSQEERVQHVLVRHLGESQQRWPRSAASAAEIRRPTTEPKLQNGGGECSQDGGRGEVSRQVPPAWSKVRTYPTLATWPPRNGKQKTILDPGRGASSKCRHARQHLRASSCTKRDHCRLSNACMRGGAQSRGTALT